MATTAASQDRSSPRFTADWSHPIPAELTVGVGPDRDVLACEMTDLSLAGCAIRIAQPPEDEPNIGILRVSPQDSESELVVAGRLCWQRQTGVGTRTYGFQFRRNIDPECLASFVQDGLVTRRDDQRERIDLAVAVRQQTPKVSDNNATLIDVSRSGVQIRTATELSVGARVLVVLPNRKTGIAEVVWSTQKGDDYFAGAGFTTIESGRKFRRDVNSL